MRFPTGGKEHWESILHPGNMWWSNFLDGPLKNLKMRKINSALKCVPWAKSWPLVKPIRKPSRKPADLSKPGVMGLASLKIFIKETLGNSWIFLTSPRVNANLSCTKLFARGRAWRTFTKKPTYKPRAEDR